MQNVANVQIQIDARYKIYFSNAFIFDKSLKYYYRLSRYFMIVVNEITSFDLLESSLKF